MNNNWPDLRDYFDIMSKKSFFTNALEEYDYSTDNRAKRPWVKQGNVAWTFKFSHHNKTKSIALRVFKNKPKEDFERRIIAISHFIGESKSSLFSDFHYIPDFVISNGDRFPAIIMDWVNGQNLKEYINLNIDNKHSLIFLMKKWEEASQILDELNCVHGDLQHGNIIINDRVRLIDYDGMFVPQLKGLPQPEYGHKNYQHKDRKHHDFGENFDRYSSIIIWSTIYIAAFTSEIFNKNRLETLQDDAILFTDSDLNNPYQSELFQELISINSIRPIIQKLRQTINTNINQTPSLIEFIRSIDFEQNTTKISNIRPNLMPHFQTALIDSIFIASHSSRFLINFSSRNRKFGVHFDDCASILGIGELVGKYHAVPIKRKRKTNNRERRHNYRARISRHKFLIPSYSHILFFNFVFIIVIFMLVFENYFT